MTKNKVSKQEIPIYEEQQENDYDATASTSGVTGYAGENNQHTNSGAGGAFSNTIYNLHAADTTHNSFLPMLDWHGKTAAALSTAATSASPYTVAYPASSSSSSGTLHQHQYPQQQHEQQSSDKISDGNFLQHYEHNSGYNELSAATTFEQQRHHQQHSHQQQQQYFSPSADSFSPHSAFSYGSSAADASEQNFYEHQHLPPHSLPSSATSSATAHGGDGYDDATNYLSTSHATNTNSQPDVINYVPYPVVKKLHVPVHQPVKIPVSHAVIVPISKPVPIQIPVAQQVQVPVEKELKIPVERVVPIPVEKHIPVPVEKRVPYPVVKYVPIKVPRPFPVKVPVFKTVLHKVKGSWW
ncbi:uncharacterized protein LOC119676550 [Teleopsis dalmanni]|uniref:uncharacterized protein LOC119676550 n=1 Tax=Teleopsis dalmanni TaxID=139649 RepID=UPI0018CD628E|nr:uncharacterized protein LOC119676550 [Teleopsis dalmanni]